MLSRIPVPRRPRFDFEAMPLYWYDGSLFLSHAVNGLALVFPKGERFFVRSVLHYAGQVEDPELQERIRGFARQEALHGRAHEDCFRVLEKQGFEVESWLERYERIAYQGLERHTPPSLRLAATAALEHLTAVMGARALKPGWLDNVHPVMRELLQWHAVEEIEHRSVAFDVFQSVDGRLWVRWIGMVIGLATLLYFWSSAAKHLVRQDPNASRERIDREKKEARRQGRSRGYVIRQAAAFLSPHFHPDSLEGDEIAAAWLAARGEGWARLA